MAASYKNLNSYLENISEWKDDVKCNALFSSFRGNPNEEDFETWMYKINFWCPLIQDVVFSGLLSNNNSVFSFSLESLQAAFVRKGVFPLGFPTIIAFQCKKGAFYSVNDFFALASLSTSSNWNLQNALKSLFWKFFRTFIEEKNLESLSNEIASSAKARYVILGNLQKFTDSLLTVISEAIKTSDIVDCCLSHFELIKLCRQVCLRLDCPDTSFLSADSIDFKLLLHYLKPVLFYHSMDVASRQKPAEQIDKSTVLNICSLKHTCQLVETQIAKSEVEQESINAELKKDETLRNKPKAIALLRKRRSLAEFEETLQKNLANIHHILSSIRFAASNIEMARSLELGAASLKGVLSNVKNKEDIDTLYLDIHEQLEKQMEISSCITGITSASGIQEEAQLEEELSRLCDDVSEKKMPSKAGEKTSEDDEYVSKLLETISLEN